MVNRISRLRFDAFVAYTRHPASAELGEEVAWYGDAEERFLGVIVRDTTDDDFGVIVLVRDIDGRFRAVDVESSFVTLSGAKRRLSELLLAHEQSGQSVFAQAPGVPRRLDLFTPVAPLGHLNSRFVSVIQERGYSPALGIMREMAFHFRDPDGNFVQQFQTDGFDSRLWELYLFGYLTEAGFLLDRSHHAPDFVAQKGDETVCLEAVTVNATANSVVKPPQDQAAFLNEYMPMKFGSPLISKLRKEYWKLPHVQGLPLILAIEDFHEEGSMTWTSTALMTYLYGYRHSWKRAEDGSLIVIPERVDVHKVGEKEVPSGFFFQPGAEHISAVLFSNSGTIAKFNRMGFLAGFGSRVLRIVRFGTCIDHDPNAAEPQPFNKIVTAPDYAETWREGVSIFHNPRASIPLNPYLFPDVAHHSFDKGLIKTFHPEFHPLGSITVVQCPDWARNAA